MGYLTLGANGRVTKDDQSVFAQGLIIPRNYQDDKYYNEIFPGSVELGKKKKKGFFKKFFKNPLFNPAWAGIMLEKKIGLTRLLKKKKKKRGGDGDAMGPESEGVESAPPEMMATSGESQAVVPESAPPAAPSVEQRAEAHPDTSPPMREEEGHAPPPVEDRPGAPPETVSESDRTATPPPWAGPPQEEAPSPFAPGEGHAGTHVEAEVSPQSSVDGCCVGGWLTTEASPAQHDWENRRPRSRLRRRGRNESVYTPPRSTATPPMWSKSFAVKRDRMGRQGLADLEGAASDGATTLLNSARGEVSQSWQALAQATAAWNQKRGVSLGVDAALKTVLVALRMFRSDADNLLIARGVEAGKKLNGWLNAMGRFMADFGDALEKENPALVTELGKWVDAFVPVRNAIANGFMADPIMEGIKAGAATFGTGLYNLAAGAARVARAAGEGIENLSKGGVPWWVWLLGGVAVVNALRK